VGEAAAKIAMSAGKVVRENIYQVSSRFGWMRARRILRPGQLAVERVIRIAHNVERN
jgi:hypothetical protein